MMRPIWFDDALRGLSLGAKTNQVHYSYKSAVVESMGINSVELKPFK